MIPASAHWVCSQETKQRIGKMSAHWLNIIGLALGMLGVLIIFKWGPPQPSFETRRSALLLGHSAAEDDLKNKEIEQQKRRYLNRSRFGLFLIFCGFGLQLYAEWVVHSSPH